MEPWEEIERELETEQLIERLRLKGVTHGTDDGQSDSSGSPTDP